MTTVFELNDNEVGFYIPPAESKDARSSGYADGISLTSNYLMRMTQGPVILKKGMHMDFTVHVKALRDFDGNNPLILRLLPVFGRGTASFAQPDTTPVQNDAVVRLDGEQIVIMMKSSDEAARVSIRLDYRPDWWGGFSKVSVQADEPSPVQGSPQPFIGLRVEAIVSVTDHVATAWSPAV